MVDYSHGIRLVQQRMMVNGATTTVAQVLADPKLAGLLSDEGPSQFRVIRPTPSRRHRLEKLWAATPSSSSPAGFWRTNRKIRVRAAGEDSPQRVSGADFAPDKPVLLIFYALPNGNTTGQTIGRLLKPGDDWHFDIQHIGAQTRFLRTLVTNRTIVIAYLEAESRAGPHGAGAWRQRHPEILGSVKKLLPTNRLEVVLTGHSGGESDVQYLNTVEKIPDDIVRIAFLDSNYAYDSARGHADKLAAWLKSSEQHCLCVLAYNDAVALLDGKPFVSAEGGTWGRSHAMLKDLGVPFDFTSRTNSAGLQFHSALHGRAQILLQENPGRKILHTVQVERNGFIHAMVAGTPDESNGYEYFGERAYTKWILPE